MKEVELVSWATALDQLVLVRFRQHLIPAVRLLGKGEAHVENEQALPRPVQARSG